MCLFPSVFTCLFLGFLGNYLGILMADGAVIFITDSIESGDQNIGTVRRSRTGPRAPGSESPYGLWGAMGTRAAKETIQEQFNQ